VIPSRRCIVHPCKRMPHHIASQTAAATIAQPCRGRALVQFDLIAVF
jgi:hypothetical protein